MPASLAKSSDPGPCASICAPSCALPPWLRSARPPPPLLFPPKRSWICLHSTPDPLRCPFVPFGGKIGAAHYDEADVPQRFEGHQFECYGQFTDGAVSVSQTGRHPAAANPRICQPWIERQGAFQPAVRLLQPTQQYESSAAQRQRQDVVGREPIGLFGELVGAVAVGDRSRTETVGRALAETPPGDRLGQSVARRQLLRPGERLESCVALLRRDGKGKWQSLECRSQGVEAPTAPVMFVVVVNSLELLFFRMPYSSPR
jgi:hypothetical protein